jgi:hypothetical protein
MKKQIFLLILLMSLAATISAHPDAVGESDYRTNHKTLTDSIKTKQTVGIAIDLLPPIMSATTGHFGYSAQLWYGYNKFRVRGVIAGFYMPDKLMGNDDFKDLRTTATALIVDFFKNYNFRGWWIGGGFEMWNNTITSKIDNNDYYFNNFVATAGTGYIIKVYKNFYVEPWGAIHYVLNNETISVSDTEYKTKKFQGEVSLKIGWHF